MEQVFSPIIETLKHVWMFLMLAQDKFHLLTLLLVLLIIFTVARLVVGGLEQ